MKEFDAEAILLRTVNLFADSRANRGVSQELFQWGEISEESPDVATGRLETGCAGCINRFDICGPIARLLTLRDNLVNQHPEISFRLRDPVGKIGSFAMNTADCDFDLCGHPGALKSAREIFMSHVKVDDTLSVDETPPAPLFHDILREMPPED